MKAYYKTVLMGETDPMAFLGGILNKPDDVYRYDLLEMAEICCNKMKEAVEENAIFFGGFDTYLNRDNNVNFGDCSTYPEGAVWSEYTIKFCPFCGVEVETIERERVYRHKVEHVIAPKIEIIYEEVKVEKNK